MIGSNGQGRSMEAELLFLKAVAEEGQSVIAKLQRELDRKDELIKQYEAVVKMVMDSIKHIKEDINVAAKG